MTAELPIDTLFSTGLVASTYPDFPYPEKICFYCSKTMTMAKAFHVLEMPFEYKCIFICYNKSCGAYDELAQKAYVKVFYSSEKAAKLLDNIKSNIIQPEKT